MKHRVETVFFNSSSSSVLRVSSLRSILTKLVVLTLFTQSDITWVRVLKCMGSCQEHIRKNKAFSGPFKKVPFKSKFITKFRLYGLLSNISKLFDI